MRTYDKRIGFLVSYQTLIPHGGIGQFTKSFVELMSEHNIKVDIITDKQPKDDDFIQALKHIGADFVYPTESLSYSTHSSIFMYGDSFCYERMINFRNAIINALENNLYDVLVCNTYETVQVASTMGLEDCIQVIAYTHLESQIFKDTKNPFLHNVNETMRKQLEVPGVYVGTQSAFNAAQISAYALPIPLPEKALFNEYNKPREGVLFIGRWEEGKNPELFLDVIEQTKLPARVMTSSNGAKKFEDRLSKLGVDYKIKVGVIGQEKVDFITDCRVAFNPSTVESYGIAFLEQMIQLPTVALKEMRWTKNFDSQYFFTTTKKEAAIKIAELYNAYPTSESYYATGALKNYKMKDSMTFHRWIDCFNEFTPKKSDSNTAKICKENTITHKDFIKSLNRKIICIDDVRSVLTNKHKFRIIYTDTDTYLTKDPAFEPNTESSGLSLFEGL